MTLLRLQSSVPHNDIEIPYKTLWLGITLVVLSSMKVIFRLCQVG